MNIRASQSNQRGNRYLAGKARPGSARQAFREAIAAAPSWSVLKFQPGAGGQAAALMGTEALRCNQEAARLDATDQPTWWNRKHHAMTALGDWAGARRSWTAFQDSKTPPGEGRNAAAPGATPIRIRMSRARSGATGSIRHGRLSAILPLPQSAHRYTAISCCTMAHRTGRGGQRPGGAGLR
ncbi:MAG: hypothetical protein U0232_01915 [Thermomicrobiales bacterium]